MPALSLVAGALGVLSFVLAVAGRFHVPHQWTWQARRGLNVLHTWAEDRSCESRTNS
jgi:hypothetical protein